MNRELSSPLANELAPAAAAAATPAARLRNRAFGLVVLAMVASLVVVVVRTAYYAITDSWVAPIHLSPQNDAVLQLQVKLAHEQAEMGRVEAELQRIDGDVKAVDAALARLSELQASASAPLAWEAGLHSQEQKTLTRVLASLEDEVKVLGRLYARQAERTAMARRDLEAGLIDARELQQQEQALDSLALALGEKRRLIDQARHERQVAQARARAFEAGLGDAALAPGEARTDSLMPEIAASKEHAARGALELIRLEAEKRSLQALRRVAEGGLDQQRELLAELQSRPLYRAIKQSIDVAFVPYAQLDGVQPGARVFACVWGVILCEDVGAVTEVLQGEVATLDPWGQPARGQYAIIELDEPAAIREKSLRIRP